MNEIDLFLEGIKNSVMKERMVSIIEHIKQSFPSLELHIKWNQPMFLDHGVFIIGFSVAKKHISVAIEKYALDLFQNTIQESGYEFTSMLFKIPEQQELHLELLNKMVRFKINDRINDTAFWKK